MIIIIIIIETIIKIIIIIIISNNNNNNNENNNNNNNNKKNKNYNNDNQNNNNNDNKNKKNNNNNNKNHNNNNNNNNNNDNNNNNNNNKNITLPILSIESSLLEAIEYFIPLPALRAIYSRSLASIAELRQVTSLFLKLDSYYPEENVDPISLQPFFYLLQQTLAETGGFLRQFLVDDKVKKYFTNIHLNTK